MTDNAAADAVTHLRTLLESQNYALSELARENRLLRGQLEHANDEAGRWRREALAFRSRPLLGRALQFGAWVRSRW